MVRRAGTAALLLLVLLATRLPLASSMPYDWDSVQYALALDRFDPAEHRPQPPGSLLYVLAGRALLPFAGEAHRALLLVGLLLSAGALAAAASFGRRFAPPHGGWALPLLLLTSPVFWLHGLVVLPYAAESLFALLLASAIRSSPTPRGATARSIAAGVVLGLAGGVRGWSEVFLLPLFVAGLVAFPARAVLAGAAAAAAATAAWLVPTVVLSGGPEAFLDSMRAHSAAGVPAAWSAGATGLGRNLLTALGYLVVAAPVATIALSVAAVRGRLPALSRRDRLLAAAWAAPPLLVAGFHLFGHAGHLLGVVPLLLALDLRAGRSARGVAAAAALQAAVFLLAPFPEASWPDLRAVSDDLALRAAAARAAAPADGTIVLGGGRADPRRGFRHAMWLLPEYLVVESDREPAVVAGAGRPLRLARGRVERWVDGAARLGAVERIVLFDADPVLARDLAPAGAWRAVDVSGPGASRPGVDEGGIPSVLLLEGPAVPAAIDRLEARLAPLAPPPLGR